MNKLRKLMKQLVKFGLVGGSSFLIDYGVLIFLTEIFHINYLISSGISFSVSVIYNYILSIVWVFEVDREKNKTKNFIIFLLLSLIGLGLNQIFMWLFVEKVNIYYMIAKILSTAIVMVYNFVTRKLFLEKKTT